jgi:hypothetical protein
MLHCLAFVLIGLLGGAPLPTLAKDANAGKAVIVADTGAPVRLCGRFRQEVRWGLPGFGETPRIDAKRSVLLLGLARSAAFRHKTDSGKTVDERISKLQISAPSSEAGLAVRRQSGKAVVVEGPVGSASSEGDVTPVVMQLASVAKSTHSTLCDN